jgi:two-component system chemotaxis sensor kinase CheA
MTMDNQEQDSFVSRFMSDYFAECDEHLAEVRSGLMTLEQGVTTGTVSRPVLDDLFRNFHSLKGLSAIAEMRDGEQLAHEMENYLRVLRSGDIAITTAGIDALVQSARTFEDILAARRLGEAAPRIEPALERLRAVTSVPSTSVRAVDAAVTLAHTGRRWQVTFSPSAALVARDVKVDTIRQRLQAIGEIESVIPRVLAGGQIAFDFIAATEDEAALRSWATDGVVYVPAPAVAAGDAAVPVTAPVRPVEGAAAPVANFVRVELARLDDLMRNVGDLVVTRSRMDDVLTRVEAEMPAADWRALVDYNERLERQLRELREGVMRVRLVPIGEVFRRMPFVVRDLARDTGKRVQIELTGQDTEIDKLLIERMLDPILHLVRNAVSHGIETPAERVSAGKAPDGTITLTATTVGESAVLEIADDGRGLDRAAIVARGIAAGIKGAENAGTDDRALLDVICAPGFSTRDVADRASGRGVGMAVVRDTVRELGGTIELSTERDAGTTFRITLPLTLAITDALIVSVGGHTFAVPQSAVREVIEVAAAAVTPIEGNELFVHRGSPLPIVRLSRVFHTTPRVAERMHALVIGSGAAAVGLLVDRIAGHREIVVKTVTDPLIKVDGVVGVTELGDGRVVLIVDPGWVVAQQVRQRGTRRAVAAPGRTT